MPPVFFIGFNRTATRALISLLEASGVPGLHWGGRHHATNAAHRMHVNLALARPILTGMEGYRAFADLTYCTDTTYLEGCRLFRDLHREHPEAYFVLNTRDVDRWLASRFAFGGGSFAARAGQALGLSPAQLADAWRVQHEAHESDATEYFVDGRGRFLRFDVEQAPLPELADFLAPAVAIDPTAWRHVGDTTR